ncbi:MAG TPA: histidine kinase [Vicinamibacterales bacterium]|nr:histidine kinase [Vicinamibacterales bacterium]
MRVGGRAVLVVLLAATLASGFSTVLAHQAVRASGGETATWRLAVLNTSFWYGWALLALPLGLLSKRLRIDRSPRLAVPIHIVAVLTAAAAHLAIQTTAQVGVLWHSLALEHPEAALANDWVAEWLRVFPIELTQLIDWELVTGAGIVGLVHAVFYYRETQQRALREAQLETRLVEAQLQTLQHQLHPHFLFNTLHAISTLMHRDVSAAERMLVRLGDLLRITLDTAARPEVRLSEEIEFLEKYVQIEQVRLGDRLTTLFDIETDVLDAAVPTLILQPIVENAIEHGIAPLGVPGRLTVSAKRDGEMLVMTVGDSGPGPSERVMASLFSGIGLSNTRARLTHQFGAHYRFEFTHRPGGFAVLIAIPFRRDAAGALSAFVA